VKDEPRAEQAAWEGCEDQEIGQRVDVHYSVPTSDLTDAKSRRNENEEHRVLIGVAEAAPPTGLKRQSVDEDVFADFGRDLAFASEAKDVNRETRCFESANLFANSRISRISRIGNVAH